MPTYVIEKRCPRRSEPERHEEHYEVEGTEATAQRLEDLIGFMDDEAVIELEPGESHTYTVDENWEDEVEVRRVS